MSTESPPPADLRVIGITLLTLIALVLPLGLDTFAVSLTLGIGGISLGRRMRTSLLFTAFETTMPLVGLAIGRTFGQAIGIAADYVAIGVLCVLAIHTLFADDDEAALRRSRDRGIGAALALGFAVSLDELGIGFAFGLLRVPIVPAIALIAVQTFVVANVGMRLGERIGERVREGAEPAAGVVMALLAIGLLVAKLAG